ncbi:beta-propeller fold lactonase family protein [Microbacterium sp.]|uniref:beta-propeller fold lactonase family protein n=1 Tax=Microbacterium sp. TaxID=51671 RepID=UPI003736C352
MRYLLGGYGPSRGGSAEGIGLLQAGAVDSPLASGPLGVGDLVVAADSPAWLAWHPSLEVVYATLAGQDAVQAFVRDGEQTFTPLGGPVSVGPDPVHVLALPQALIVARAGDGAIARVAVDESGRPGAVTEWPAADAAASDGDDGSGFASAGADLDL